MNTDTDTQLEPLLSATDVLILNAARTVLMRLEDRTSRGARPLAGVEAHSLGRLAGMAAVGYGGLFDVLNIATNYWGVELTSGRLHDRDDRAHDEVTAALKGGGLAAPVCSTVVGALLRWAAFGGDRAQAVAALDAVEPRGLEAWAQVVEGVARILNAPLEVTTTFRCSHGYTSECPECDVPAHEPGGLEARP